MENKSVDVKETGEEITALRKLARKTCDRKLRQRCDIVRLFLLGKRKKEIALIMDVSLTQVYLILNLYKNTGIEGLTPKTTDRQKNEIDCQTGSRSVSCHHREITQRCRIIPSLQLDSPFGV